MDIFLQQIINGLTAGSVYALVALGYTMVYGIIGLINFAHGDVVMVGAMIATSVVMALVGHYGDVSAFVAIAAALLISIPVCMALGWTAERIAYRPLRRAPRLAALITAIGVSIIIQNVAMMFWGRNYLNFPHIIEPVVYQIGDARLSLLQITIMLGSALIMVALLLLVHRTRLGMAMRATAQNREVAGLMGVNINTVISAAFLIGSALAAIAGVMITSYYGVAQYTMGFMLGLKAFTAAVLGGIGNLGGAVLGGLLLGLIEALGSGYVGDLTNGVFGSHYQDVFSFIVLVVVWVGAFAIGLVLLVMPFLLGATAGQGWIRILNFALLYVMLALGLNIVVGFAGLLDLGYIAFYAVGAYVWALLASPHFNLHLPFWVILPVGIALAAIAGIALGFPVLKLRGDYLAIVTLGFGEIIRIFMNNLDAPVNITNGPQGINRIDTIKIGEWALGRPETILGFRITGPEKYYYVLMALVLLIIFICIRLQNSRVGRAWEAVREDEIAAKAMGINTRTIKLMAFAMGASFGGAAGCLFASMQGFVSPESFGLSESIAILCMVVLGGMGHVPGVVAGALLLSIFPEVLRNVVVPIQQTLFGEVLVDPDAIRMLLFGVALVAVMIFRPEGLWPSQVRKREVKSVKEQQA